MARGGQERVLGQVRAGVPQRGRPVHEVQPAEEAEREVAAQGLRRAAQAPGQGALPRGLSAEELAVQRLVAGTRAAHARTDALTPTDGP